MPRGYVYNQPDIRSDLFDVFERKAITNVSTAVLILLLFIVCCHGAPSREGFADLFCHGCGVVTMTIKILSGMVVVAMMEI